MLRLAMSRLKIPARFVNLTINLFSNRFNSIITAFGNTSPYKVQIGIDQGEVISPLLWVIYIDPLLTMLNLINPTPYTLNTDPHIDPVNISTIGYMDDTNLISSSTEGITSMLSSAQEFYNFNNTKINFKKAIIVCNRELSDNDLPISSQPAPFTFDLGVHSFALTPLPPKDSFRFLGVWFTLSLSQSYIKKQCKTEYALVVAKLRFKKLTNKQLIYLRNMVLMPKVLYRLKATLLSDKDCQAISLPFRSMLKRSLQLVSTIPNNFLSFHRAIGLTDLFQRNLIDHSARFERLFNLDNNNFTKLAFLHRLTLIQQELHVPFSPLYLHNFNAFSKTKCFQIDSLFRLLHFSSQIGISFAFNQLTVSNNWIPIHEAFHEAPSLFAKSIHLLRKHNVRFINDCIAPDASAILPFSSIMKKNYPFTPPVTIPKWYKHLLELTALHSNSIRLKDVYKNLCPSEPISDEFS